MTDEKQIGRRFRLKRAAKLFGIVIAGLVLVIVALAAALLLPPVRGKVLTRVLADVGKVLPGDLTVGKAAWPSLGTFELSDVLWVDGADTLAMAGRLKVSTRLAPLVHKDVHVKEIIAEGIGVDVPAIAARFGGERDSLSAEPKKDGRGFPRPGSLPGIPSISIDSIYVSAPAIRIDEGLAVTGVVLSAGFDVSYGKQPIVRVDTLTARGSGDKWSVDELALVVDLERGRVDGKGSGEFAPYGPVHLFLSTDDGERITLVVATEAGQAPPEEIGLRISGDVTLDGARVQAIDFDCDVRTPGTRELAEVPGLESRMEGLPELDGVSFSMKGRVEFNPEFSADVTTEINKNNWIESGEVTLAYRNGTLDCRQARIDLPGLSITGHGSVATDSVGVFSEIDCRGTEWLAALRPDFQAPDPLTAGLTVEAARPPGSTTSRVAIRGEGRIGGFEFDELDISAVLPAVTDRPSLVDFRMHSLDAYLGLSAEVSIGETIAAKLSPIVLQTVPIPQSKTPVSGRGGGSVEYTAATGRISADPIRVAGDAGQIAVWADLVLDEGGTYRLEADWPEPPRLLTRSLGLADAKLDSLAATWQIDAPFEISLEGHLETNGAPRTATTGTFMLPGPRNLAALFPDSARVGDLGPIMVDITAATYPDSAGTGFDVVLDFGRTGWIDSSVIDIKGLGGSVVLDTLVLAFQGVSLNAAGTLTEGGVDLLTNLNIANSQFAERFVPSIPQFNVNGTARVDGALEFPHVNASFAGAVRGVPVEVPSFTASLDLDSSHVTLDIEAPSGITTPQIKLGHASLSARSAGGINKLIPIQVSMTAAGEQFNLGQSLRVDTVGGITIDVDAFELDIAGKDLRASRSFQIRLPGDSKRIVVDSLDLEGTLGSVNIDGFVDPDSSDLDGIISIKLPSEPPPALAQPKLWPSGVDVEFKVSGTHNVTVDAQVDGFEMIDGRRPLLDLSLIADAEHIEAGLTAADSTDSLVECDLWLPAVLSLFPFSFDYVNGEISANAVLANFPVAMRTLGDTGEIPGDQTVRLDGTLAIRGPVGSPFGRAAVGVDFTGWPKFSQYGLSVGAIFGSSGRRDSLFSTGDFPGMRAAKDLLGSGDSGIEALVRVKRLDDEVLSVEGFYPIIISLDPPQGKVPEGGELHLRANSKEIALDDLDPLLPVDVGLGGFVTINLRGDGPVDDVILDGSFVTRGFEVRVAEKARMLARSNIRINGSTQRPSAEGEIVIESALIRVPDLPKNLHPTEGDAMLLREAVDTVGGTDSTVVRAKPPKTRGRKIDAELDVEIKIPSGFWIRGKGLDIELSGSLMVGLAEGKPTIGGELRAIRGSLVVLGRTLVLERGTVTFFGDDEMNPSLDIVLATTINGTEIQILMGGTVEQPAVNLVSNPEMSESDIMSVLLFGRTMENLDDEQTDLARKRSTEMLASLGAAKLQQEVGGQIGVDVMTIKSTGRDDEGSALTVGKYLNPHVLLSYAQALDMESDSFVSLEYFLRGQFKLESTYGQRGQTSLGFGWAKDY